ncbi:MAG TPA: amidohydrolase family protein, partial [Planctomycetota bacterium]|nr:amidohydrolase family protein [Planctomycetota bacterium]
AGSQPPPAGYRVVDVSGLQVWPGLIDAGCHVGLAEIDTVAGSMDVAEIGQDQPDLRASAAWHASAEAIAVTRVNGTTLALVVPEGGRVMGQSSAMALEGWTAAEAVVADAVALHLRAPRTPRQDELRKPGEREGPPPGAPDAKEEKVPEDPAELARLVDEHWEPLDRMFDEAREYARWTGEASRRGVPGPEFDPRLEALAPYAIGQALVVIEANAADEIMDALRFGERQKLKLAISGGHEAWKVAHELALLDIPVILGPVLTLPRQREDPFDSSYHDAAVLADAGVRIAFRSNDSASARDLPYHAAMAVAYGLPEDRALRALTADAAAILGLESEAGTLTPGKRADVLVTDGSPLQIRTHLTQLFIGGRDVGLETRHTQLYERYRTRLHDPAAPNRP